MQLVGLNFFAGNMPDGDRGRVSWPARSGEFRDNVDVTVGVGEQLGAGRSTRCTATAASCEVGTAASAAGRLGHVQIADAPGRHEPGTGALDVDGYLRRLAVTGYDGWVGLEYGASGDRPFDWLRPHRS